MEFLSIVGRKCQVIPVLWFLNLQGWSGRSLNKTESSWDSGERLAALLLSLLLVQFKTPLEKHWVSSCVVGVGEAKAVGVMMSSLDLDLLEHGLHDDEEVGLVNRCVWQASPGIWGEDTQLFTLSARLRMIYSWHTLVVACHMEMPPSWKDSSLPSTFFCFLFKNLSAAFQNVYIQNLEGRGFIFLSATCHDVTLHFSSSGFACKHYCDIHPVHSSSSECSYPGCCHTYPESFIWVCLALKGNCHLRARQICCCFSKHLEPYHLWKKYEKRLDKNLNTTSCPLNLSLVTNTMGTMGNEIFMHRSGKLGL